MALISVKNLHFHYQPGVEVLKDINLTFDRTSTAIIGQNGAGKTTFVKLLKGLLKPNTGDVFINGLNTREHSVASLSRQIGLIFQNPSDQIFKNRVLDEVMFGPLNLKIEKEEAEARAVKALERVNMAERKEDNPYDLGLSARKMVTIASILAMDTDIIIFDEPTISQDYENIELIKDIIGKLEENGKLVITINHDMDFVSEVFKRIIVFKQGEVIIDGPPEQVFSQEKILKEAYLETPHVTKLASKLGLKEIVLKPDHMIDFLKQMG